MKCLVCFCVLFHLCYASASTNPKCSISSDPFHIDCSNLKLKTIPQNLEHVANHTRVKKLIFSNNELNSSITFQNWGSLIYLDVSSNSINNISNHTFGPLSHLKFLNLSYNNISYIAENAFDFLTVLEILDLSGNPLLGYQRDMLQKALSGLLFRSLIKLTIRSSNLSETTGMFVSAHELLYLDLSNNNITTIPVLPKRLSYLNVNNNSIKTIGILPFQQTLSLRELYIENNPFLNEIDVDAFEKLYNLRILSLKGNKNLTNLPAHLLYFNKKLKHLSLANCNFKSLPYTFKSVFAHIRTVELQDNPWVCNVSIKWFAHLNGADEDNFR